MLKNIFQKLENPKRPLLGPNVKALQFWGLLLPKNVLKKYFYILMHILVTIFTATEYIDVWFVKSDMSLLLNNLKITMLATMSVIKVTTFLCWQKYWISIIEYVTKADLNQRMTSDKKKLELLSRFTKYCRKITYLYWSLMYTTVIIVMVQPIFKYVSSETYRLNVKNGTDTYLQVVSSWVPWDKNNVVGYLAASVYQSYAAIYGGGWITSFDTNSMVIMVFFRAELELLRIDSTNIFGSESKQDEHDIAMKRLKDCHRRHVELVNTLNVRLAVCVFSTPYIKLLSLVLFVKSLNFLIVLSSAIQILTNTCSHLDEFTQILYSTNRFARLFDSCLSPIMLLYMFVCSVMLCVTAYQITIETNPMQRFLTTEYLVFGVAQLFIYCWHSNDVLFASDNLMRGPYESIWWTKSVKYRKDLYLLVAQFNKTVVFSAGPFTMLTVATFINILKGAYSYYTLLSQSQMK